jgi:putative glutamine amidotransferase
MPAAPVIGISTYPRQPGTFREGGGRFHLPTAYVEALRRAGALPWLIPPGEPLLSEVLGHLDGLVLSGGGDVDPGLYGGRPGEFYYEVDRERDQAEIAMTRSAIESGLPTLAICRGCQIVNVALGGTLIEHIPDEVDGSVQHRGEGPGTVVPHAVSIESDSRLFSIIGASPSQPNSSHHQAVRRPAQGLRVTARAADGVIEAFELEEHPFLLGVQWHPEETAATDPVQQKLFDALVAAARKG